MLRREDLIEHRTSELWGWLQGISAARDPDRGIARLATWLESCEELHEAWPASALRGLLAPALDPRWREQGPPEAMIGAIRRQLSRLSRDVRTSAEQWALQPLARYDRIDAGDIVFEEAHVVITGEPVGCEREMAQAWLRLLGARVRSQVAMKGTYLLVGSRASAGWKHSRRGRKIERVERWRAQGRTQCLIVAETVWARALVDAARAQLKS